MAIWSRTYVCCAIPLYNSGIYLIMAQFVIVALVTGILSFAAPHIVAVSIPTAASIVFGLVCIAVAIAQVVGFFGVYRERPNLFKTYARVNAGLVGLALLLAIIFIGVSAGNHGKALITCEELFVGTAGSAGGSTSTIAGNTFANGGVTSGTSICNVWTWAQLGVMGLLFLIIALTEAYFLMYQGIYASEQRLDHARYDSVYSTAAEEIRQSGLWDSNSVGRPSSDLVGPKYTDRSASAASGLRNEIQQDEYAPDSREGGYNEGRFTPPVTSNSAYETNQGYYQGAPQAAPAPLRSNAGSRAGSPYYPNQPNNTFNQQASPQANYSDPYGGMSNTNEYSSGSNSRPRGDQQSERSRTPRMQTPDQYPRGQTPTGRSQTPTDPYSYRG